MSGDGIEGQPTEKENAMENMTLTIDGNRYEGVSLREVGKFIDGSMAYELYLWDGEPLARVNVHLVGNSANVGCIWVKDWSENEGLAAELQRLGLAELTGRYATSGFVAVPEMRLLGEWAEASEQSSKWSTR